MTEDFDEEERCPVCGGIRGQDCDACPQCGSHQEDLHEPWCDNLSSVEHSLTEKINEVDSGIASLDEAIEEIKDQLLNENQELKKSIDKLEKQVKHLENGRPQ